MNISLLQPFYDCIDDYGQILSAYEFEQHAGGAKTRHPNNHIFLENGRPIYSIIEELKTAPLGILEELVTDMAGSSVNQGSFQAWKGDYDVINSGLATIAAELSIGCYLDVILHKTL